MSITQSFPNEIVVAAYGGFVPPVTPSTPPLSAADGPDAAADEDPAIEPETSTAAGEGADVVPDGPTPPSEASPASKSSTRKK